MILAFSSLVQVGFDVAAFAMLRTTSFCLFQMKYHCEEPRLGLNQLSDGTERRMTPLQDKDLSGIDIRLVAGFSRLWSEMLLNGSGLCPNLWAPERFV